MAPRPQPMTLVTMASAMAMTVSRMTVPSMEERVTFRPTLAKKTGERSM